MMPLLGGGGKWEGLSWMKKTTGGLSLKLYHALVLSYTSSLYFLSATMDEEDLCYVSTAVTFCPSAWDQTIMK